MKATFVRPLVVRAMGVYISAQESKEIQRYLRESFAYLLNVCDEVNEA